MEIWVIMRIIFDNYKLDRGCNPVLGICLMDI